MNIQDERRGAFKQEQRRLCRAVVAAAVMPLIVQEEKEHTSIMAAVMFCENVVTDCGRVESPTA